MPTFPDVTAWYASLATLYGTAAALITSPAGEVLLVKPNYRELWSLPGGVLEDGDLPPHMASRVAGALRARSTGRTVYLSG